MAVEDAHIRGDIDAAAAKQRITQLGLAHSLLTQHTSFIAVDATPQAIGQKLPRQPIPNLTPHGQTTKTLAYPQTATTAGLSFWLGLLLLMGYLFIRAMRDDDF